MYRCLSLFWCSLFSIFYIGTGSYGAQAAILSASVLFDAQNDLYTYNYSIDNAGGTAAIWQLNLLIAPFGAGELIDGPSAPFTSVTSPQGWTFGITQSGSIANPPYNEVGKFLSWQGEGSAVQVGAMLTGFSFSTHLAPTTSLQNNYFLYGDVSLSNLILNGDANIAEYGTILAPLAPVPEPSTWAMLLLGFLGLGLVAYRRQRLTPATI